MIISPKSGGSGGGVYADYTSSIAPGAGTLGQGFSGGRLYNDTSSSNYYVYGGGGGGGKRTPGFDAKNRTGNLSGGWGGRGVSWYNYPVAGGGGGGTGDSSYNDHGLAVDGGGNGAHLNNFTLAVAGQANTGGGGGGGAYTDSSDTNYRALSAGKNGGSGVLIFRYPTTYNITAVPSNAVETNQYDGYKYAIVRSSCIATVNKL